MKASYKESNTENVFSKKLIKHGISKTPHLYLMASTTRRYLYVHLPTLNRPKTEIQWQPY